MYSIVRPFKKGHIILWYESIASIPAGWQLCNGDNDSPDLSGRFVKAAGSGYSPGEHHDQTTHTHTYSGVSHSHDFIEGEAVAFGAGFAGYTAGAGASGATGEASSEPVNWTLCYIMKL